MSVDKRLFKIVSNLANNDRAGAIDTFKSVFEDRIASSVRDFTIKSRVKPNATT